MSESRGENQNSHSEFSHTDDATSIIFALPTPTPFSAHHLSAFSAEIWQLPRLLSMKRKYVSVIQALKIKVRDPGTSGLMLSVISQDSISQ